MTYLAVPITASNFEQAKRQIKSAVAGGAEMLELRTDYLEGLGTELVKELIGQVRTAAIKPVPVIVTCRDKRQGGVIDYPEKLRIDVLTAALQAGADFIDLEYENFLPSGNQRKIKQALSQGPKGRLVLSAHNFETRFDDIVKLHNDIKAACKSAIPKLVYMANHINNCFDAFDLLHNKKGELIVFCMGEAGLISRIIAKKLNSFLTFASIDEDAASAPGQLTIEQVKNLYRWDGIKSDTELYGVIGSPISHSLSPSIHNGCFVEKDFNKLYLPLLVEGGREEFELFMDNCLSRQWLGFRGLSITIPHKQNALNYVRNKKGFVEPLAERIGAANTIVIGEDNKLSAYNTDYAGALDAITAGLGISRDGLKDLAVAVIGAGGVARAIVAGLSDAGAKIKIYNRTVSKAEKLAGEFGCEFAPLDNLANLNAKLVINCTSIGMKKTEDRRRKTEDRGPRFAQKATQGKQKTGYETPVPSEVLKSDMAVFDTVYNPAETLLLKQAKEVGCKTISGMDMFINQAAGQFKLFTGKKANTELMRKVVI